MNCIPRLDGDDTKELSVIEGMVPSFDDMPEAVPSVQDVLMQRKSAESKMPELEGSKWTQGALL